MAALLAATGGGMPPLPRRRRRALPDSGPLAQACERCGAEPGEPCNRRTLGRHHYHLVRVEDAADAEAVADVAESPSRPFAEVLRELEEAE